MSDESYEETRAARTRQARALMNVISRYKKAATLLDVGPAAEFSSKRPLLSDSRREALSPQTYCRPHAWRASPPRAQGAVRSRHSHRRHRARTQSCRLDARHQERNGAGRDLRSRYARRKLGRRAFDGLEVVAFSRGSHWLFQQVHAYFGVRDGRVTRQRHNTTDVAPAFELPRRTGVQISPRAVSFGSAFDSGSNCCPNQFV
jgi:hypothetical protein